MGDKPKHSKLPHASHDIRKIPNVDSALAGANKGLEKMVKPYKDGGKGHGGGKVGSVKSKGTSVAKTPTMVHKAKKAKKP